MTPISFTSRQVRSSQTLSERLQAARRLRGISLEDVAQSIGVQERYLEWIEDGRFDKLPAGVYTRGFLTRYAEEMNLPVDEILSLYDHELGIDTNLRKARGEELPEEKPIETRKTRFLFSPKTIRLGIVLLIVIALMSYLVIQFRTLSAPPELIVSEPAENITTEAEMFQVIGTVEEGSRLLLNGSDVRVAADGTFSVEIPLESGENHLRFVATSPVGKETILERSIILPEAEKEVLSPIHHEDPPEETSVDDPPSSDAVDESVEESDVSDDEKPLEESDQVDDTETEETTSSAEPFSFTLMTDEDTWVHVVVDDSTAFSGVLTKGEEHIFEAESRIFLSSGKAYLTRGKINDEDLGRLGEKGEVLNAALITSSGVAK